MKLMAIMGSRSIWLQDMKLFNPTGKKLFPEIVLELQKRYGFAKVPTSYDEWLHKDGARFVEGGFKTSDAVVSIDLTVYADGLTVDCRAGTEYCDEFLAEVLKWASARFQLPDPQSIRCQIMYSSELDIQLEADFERVASRFRPVIGQLRSPVGAHPYICQTLSFGLNPALPMRSTFEIQRRTNIDASENRFYSHANLQTQAHISVLKELESLLNEKDMPV